MMTPIQLNGTALSLRIQADIKETTQQYIVKGYRPPKLMVVLVGEQPASVIYVHKKQLACERTGICSELIKQPETITEADLLSLIEQLNQNKALDGILVQLPLPAQINVAKVLDAIHPDKDVDGFHPQNLGLLAQGRPHFRACTAYGVMQLLETLQCSLSGLHAVVVGASDIAGKPIALELLKAGCTVTICHIATHSLQHHVQQADLLVSAIGKIGIIQSEWIKQGAIIVDVGINRLANGKIVGDIEFETATLRARAITPVPGGVGPMTVTALLQNTLKSYQKRILF